MCNKSNDQLYKYNNLLLLMIELKLKLFFLLLLSQQQVIHFDETYST